jgi:hypothetical protein
MKANYSITRKLLICIFIASSFVSAYPQEKIKFGKIELADLKLAQCPFDSSADAMVLGDVGQTYFEYDDNTGFTMYFDRLVRIKIFTKKGYAEADMEIPLYHTGTSDEKLVTLKARTYNLENGKITETKVSDESIFDEEVDAFWKNKKITFPAVREGSVVELKYTVKSHFLANMRDWYFQGKIPVRWSEYEVRIPEYFHYSKQASGFFAFKVNETSSTQKRITSMVTNHNASGVIINSSSYSNASINYTENIFRLATENVPSFTEENFTNSILNYLSRIEFEFVGYQFPDEPFHAVNSTWEEIVENLEKDNDFGIQIKKGGLVKDIVSGIEGKTKDSLTRMIMAYDYIRSNMKWNEFSSKYPTTSLRKALQLKTGNSADINLSLVLLLRELDLPAEPVILSTRQHGLVFKAQPSVSKMNYVIALVNINGKEYLLDATSRLRPYTMLPFRCLNGEGLVVSMGKMRWVPLLQGEKDNSFIYGEMKILAEGTIQGKFEISKSGNPGVDERNNFLREGSENYKKSFKESFANWVVDEVALENMDDPKEVLKITCKVSSADIAEANDNMIYLNALLNQGQKTNPFRQETRKYPVDFGCPQKDVCVFNYEIPEGYAVESIPENMKLLLPDKDGFFKFIATVSGNKISLSSQIQINKAMFLPSEYVNLRNFYNQITIKHAQQIVLKKL